MQELTKQDIDVHNIVVNQVIFKGPQDFSALLDARIRVRARGHDLLRVDKKWLLMHTHRGETFSQCDLFLQMQNKYLEQYDELYGEDMCLIKMPLLDAEVRGLKQLDGFSKYLLQPYEPPVVSNTDPWTRIKELEEQIEGLQQQLKASKA